MIIPKFAFIITYINIIATIILYIQSINTQNPTILSNIINYNRHELISLVLAADDYDRDQNNVLKNPVELKDYINKIFSYKLIIMLRKYIIIYPELNNIKLLEQLAKIDSNKTSQDIMSDKLSYSDKIKLLSLYKLRILVNECENKKYKNNDVANNILNDYIDFYNEQSLYNYLLNCLESDTLSTKNNSIIKQLEAKLNTLISNKDFKEYIDNLDIVKLVSYVLSIDEYDREYNSNRIGGLTDFIHLFNKQEIIDLLIKYSNKHPEVKNNYYLDILVDRFKNIINNKISMSNLCMFLNPNKKLFDKSELIEVALILERYANNIANIKFESEIYIYIYNLPEQSIYKIINRFLLEYKNLNNIEFIRSLVNNKNLNFKFKLIDYSLEDIKSYTKRVYDLIVVKNNDYENIKEEDIKSMTKEECLNYLFAKVKIHKEIFDI